MYCPINFPIKPKQNVANHPDDAEVFETITIYVQPPCSAPASPSNLIANTESQSMIKLYWDDKSLNEEGFRIERKPAGGSFQTLGYSWDDSTSYCDYSAVEGITYNYRVCAYNSVGDSEYSTEIISETLSADAQLTWNSNENGTLMIDKNVTSIMLGYVFTCLTNGSITKIGGFFNGRKTVYLWQTTNGVLLAKADIISENDWQYSYISPISVSSGESYTVAVHSDTDGESWHQNIDVLPRVYDDIRIEKAANGTSLSMPTNYYYTSIIYGQADIEFLFGDPLPKAITNFTVIAENTNRAVLSWEDKIWESGYIISTNGPDKNRRITNLGADVTSWTDTNNNKDKCITYYIIATNSRGTGPYWASNSACFIADVSIEYIISNVQLGGVDTDIVPGATITMNLNYSNSGIYLLNNTVTYVFIAPYVMYLSNSSIGSAGWSNQYSTNTNPDQSFGSSDYISSEPSANKVKWLRWKNESFAVGDSGKIIYKIVIK